MVMQSIFKDQEILKSPFGKGGNKSGFYSGLKDVFQQPGRSCETCAKCGKFP
jgi:hypothetical protein